MLTCIFLGFSSGMPLVCPDLPGAGLVAQQPGGPCHHRPVRAGRAALHLEIRVVAADGPVQAAVPRPPAGLGAPDAARALLSIGVLGQFDPSTSLADRSSRSCSWSPCSAPAKTSSSMLTGASCWPTTSSEPARPIFVNAYRLSGLVPGSLALILADYSALDGGVLGHRPVHAGRYRRPLADASRK